VLAIERQKRIHDYLVRAEFASLDELSEEVDVSVSTVRRDLASLESAGVVRRTHGGARLLNPRSDEFAFTIRDTHQLREKEAIGKACAERLGSNQSVIIDAGTTAYHVARNLGDKAPQIVTNSLPVAQLFANSAHVELILCGGVIYPRLGVLVGPMVVESFSRINADVAILSAGGLTMAGLTNSHSLLVDAQRAMIRAAARVMVCLDHTKFDRRSVAKLCDLDVIHTIVTDSAAPDSLIRGLRARKIEVVIAS
jgi:DeoR/GlpR family transcriptional regulator of sugar metabolism